MCVSVCTCIHAYTGLTSTSKPTTDPQTSAVVRWPMIGGAAFFIHVDMAAEKSLDKAVCLYTSSRHAQHISRGSQGKLAPRLHWTG